MSYDPHDPLEWLKAQDHEAIVAYAARSALRALPNIAGGPNGTHGSIALPILRAIIISVVAGRIPSAQMSSAATSAALFADIAAHAADSPDGSAAHSAARAAAHSAATAAQSAHQSTYSSVRSANSAAQSYDSAASAARHAASAASVPRSAARVARSTASAAHSAESAAGLDAKLFSLSTITVSIFNRSLWHGIGPPEGVAANLDNLRRFFEADPTVWGYWSRWYDGFLTGAPLGWALQERIALISDAEWEAGPARIAELIRSFEIEASPSEVREPEFEPTDVDRLLRYRQTAALQSFNLAYTIDDAITRFHAETGLNQLPEVFAALPGIQGSLTKVTWLLQSDHPDTAIAQQLREQVGRLKARVAELEEALRMAQSGGTPIVAPAFKEQCGKSLGDWKLFAALVGGLWFISGEDVQMTPRLENLRALRTSLFGDVCPLPEPARTSPLIHDI